MFTKGRAWGFDIPDRDPTAGLVNPARELPRDRILFDGVTLVAPDPRTNEIGALAHALMAEPSPVPVSRPTRLALMLTLLFGLRVSETSSLEWRGILLDGESPTVTVTRSKTRAGLRALPLPRAAVEILTELRAQAGKDGYVFPGADGGSAAERRTPHLHPKLISRGFSRACVKLGVDGARPMTFAARASPGWSSSATRPSPSGSPATPRAIPSAAITTVPANWARCASRSRHGPPRSTTRAGGSRRKGRERRGGAQGRPALRH